LIHNCFNCDFANVLENGDCDCKKRENEGIKIIIKKNKLHIECPAHPSNFEDISYIKHEVKQPVRKPLTKEKIKDDLLSLYDPMVDGYNNNNEDREFNDLVKYVFEHQVDRTEE
jgi:hypothetical protein